MKEEIGNEMQDNEIEVMRIRLLRSVSILITDREVKAERVDVTESELKVLTFLHEEICNRKGSPSCTGPSPVRPDSARRVRGCAF